MPERCEWAGKGRVSGTVYVCWRPKHDDDKHTIKMASATECSQILSSGRELERV